MLLNPRRVFAQLLKDKGLEEEGDESDKLKTTFNRLVEMVEQGNPEEMA
jgi:predicted phage tail protein